jgi:hypothetical protein
MALMPKKLVLLPTMIPTPNARKTAASDNA